MNILAFFLMIISTSDVLGSDVPSLTFRLIQRLACSVFRRATLFIDAYPAFFAIQPERQQRSKRECPS